MMKLVTFAAVALMCLAPVVRLAVIGAISWAWALMGEAIGIPVALALVAFPIVERGPFKDWLIRALLLCSVSIALGFSVYSLLWGRSIWATGVTRATFYFPIFLLALPFVALARKVMPSHAMAAAFSGEDVPAR